MTKPICRQLALRKVVGSLRGNTSGRPIGQWGLDQPIECEALVSEGDVSRGNAEGPDWSSTPTIFTARECG